MLPGWHRTRMLKKYLKQCYFKNEQMKILAVASGGGHWIELLRLKPAFEDHEVVYASTNGRFADTVKGHRHHILPEVSVWNKWKVFSVARKAASIISSENPDIIISTGAGPGVVALFVAKLKGKKTVWIESLCHAEKISISGKMAVLFADKVYTQWPHLSSSNIVYAGNIML
jgi:UDP-N-acetylglucosamine:LPS N-acetylglucosamine transferase